LVNALISLYNTETLNSKLILCTHNTIATFPKKAYNLAGFELGSPVLGADAFPLRSAVRGHFLKHFVPTKMSEPKSA
jgi:hypothetical protein